jgi:hypothetical protein
MTDEVGASFAVSNFRCLTEAEDCVVAALLVPI